MKVNRITVRSLDTAVSILKANGVQELESHCNRIYGYNAITNEINIERSDHKYYVIKRFDGKSFCIYARDMNTMHRLLFNINNYGVKLEGDIVNLGIDYELNINIQEKNCIAKKYYCPTISGIYHYMNYMCNYSEDEIKYNNYKNKRALITNLSLQSKDNPLETEVNTGLTREQLDNVIVKAQMIGQEYFLVDTNTILVPLYGTDRNIVYTMQPQVFDKFIDVENNLTDNINEYNIHRLQYIRNYRIQDIPGSQYVKYLYRYGSTTTPDGLYVTPRRKELVIRDLKKAAQTTKGYMC